MAQLETCVRSIQLDGLVWGASKLVPVGYGIRKLQIQCVVEDDKVGTDLLEEEITKFEEHVSGHRHKGMGDRVNLGHWLLHPTSVGTVPQTPLRSMSLPWPGSLQGHPLSLSTGAECRHRSLQQDLRVERVVSCV